MLSVTMLVMSYIIKDKIQFLSNASKILSKTLDYNITLVSVAKLIVDNIADFCIIDIIENGEMTRVVVRTSKRSDQQVANKFFNFLPDPKNKLAIYDAATSEIPILIKKVDKRWLKTISRIKEEKEAVKQLDLKSMVFAPLISRGKVIGVITIGSSKDNFSYTPDDVLFIDEIAGRAALAVDNARLFSEAQQAIQSRDEFISIASHELKTPLTSILLTLQFAVRRLKKQDRDDGILSAIETGVLQTRRLSALMNDLLNISVITTGKLKIEKEKADLVDLLTDTLSSFDLESKKNGVRIKFKTDRKKVVGMWDKVRLGEVFSNLVSNALKYGDKKPIRIKLSVVRGRAIIEISDKGIGINEEEKKHIFELFRRTIAAKNFKGMGVGLYISNQIVEAHKGKINVQSKEGKGSTFIVELPL